MEEMVSMTSDQPEKEESEAIQERNNESRREIWSKPIEFTLTLVGYSVGIGTLWRFPYVCMRNGGGAFLLPYFISMVICGFPLYVLEVCIGQLMGQSAATVWKLCPLLNGLGYSMCLISGAVLLTSTFHIALTLRYLFESFAGVFPWKMCGNPWNTPSCWDFATLERNSTGSNETSNLINCNLTGLSTGCDYVTWKNETRFVKPETRRSPSEEFWLYKVFGPWSGLENIGTPNWELVICFILAWILCLLCIIKGVRTVGKVVYITALLPYVLLTVIFGCAITLPGAKDGILLYITPRPESLLDIHIWVEAVSQVFYSLGPAWGGLITFGSFNKIRNNSFRDALVGTLSVSFTSVYGGCVVFAVFGSWTKHMGVKVSDILNYGPGMTYITYPDAVQVLPIPQIWAVLLFLTFLTVGLDSVFGMLETVSSGIFDLYPKLKKRRTLILVILTLIYILMSLPLTTPGGTAVAYLLDSYLALLGLPIIALGECIVIGWIFGTRRFSRCLVKMMNFQPSRFFHICWCFVTPALMVGLVFYAVLRYRTPVYGDYKYPPWAESVGWLLAAIPVLPIPFVALTTMIRLQGTVMERLKKSVKPAIRSKI